MDFQLWRKSFQDRHVSSHSPHPFVFPLTTWHALNQHFSHIRRRLPFIYNSLYFFSHSSDMGQEMAYSGQMAQSFSGVNKMSLWWENLQVILTSVT